MELAIIGGGPSGLRAAQVAAEEGAKVTLYDSKRSVGRKFLVAGRGGLNLTHSESRERFVRRYTADNTTDLFWTSLLSEFDNTATRAWAASLGIETFVGTSGRVFPKEFKSAPLLRRWVEHLRTLGVLFKTSHQLVDLERQDNRFSLLFKNNDSIEKVTSSAVILALGGGSWPVTGSTGEWVTLLRNLGLRVLPLTAANCGWEVNWNQDILRECEGLPLKNLLVKADEKTVLGELMITRYGLEGGALYQLGSTLRQMKSPELTLDLKPSFSDKELENKINQLSPTQSLLELAVRQWKLPQAPATLLRHYTGEGNLNSPLSLARCAKALRIPLLHPRPLEEAISSAGGIAFTEVDDSLMVRRLPGIFIAGEMLDWEAPTGGYLLQGCLATGTRAARSAIRYLNALPG